MSAAYPVHLTLDRAPQAPPVRAEVQALGEVHALSLDTGEGSLELPAPPRFLRLRLWCGAEAEAAVCGELLYLPDSVHHAELSLALEDSPEGWRVVEVDSGPALPLPLQVGLGTGLVVLVGLLTLRRLRRGP